MNAYCFNGYIAIYIVGQIYVIITYKDYFYLSSLIPNHWPVVLQVLSVLIIQISFGWTFLAGWFAGMFPAILNAVTTLAFMDLMKETRLLQCSFLQKNY